MYGKIHYSAGSLFFMLLLTITRSGRLAEIRWSFFYIKISEKFVRIILQDWFQVVHIPFFRMVKFQFFAQFRVDHLSYPVMSSLIRFLH